jgi:putative transposase
MLKTYKYKLEPNKHHRFLLEKTLDTCRDLHNICLEQRQYQRVHRFEQDRQLTALKQEFPEYQFVHCDVLQNVIKRLQYTFDNFVRGAGFPRFKSRQRYNSFAYKGTGFKLSGRYLQLSKIGNVKVRLSREIPEYAVIKTCSIKRTVSGWYALFVVDLPFQPLLHADREVGIDVGVVRHATLTDGTVIPNPRFYQNAQAELRRAQRRISRRKKGSRRRRKAAILLQKVHEHIANRRSDFLHKQTTALVQKYGIIVVENLNVAGMAQGNCAKQVYDASWGTWLRMLAWKAASAARRLIAVDPRYTSQTCPCCGYKDKKNRPTQAEFRCLDCGFEANADWVGSVNILARMEPSGANVGELTPCVI